MNLEEQIMELIINAGQARSFAHEAMRAARENNFAEAEEALKQAHASAKDAHSVQTRLIEADQGEGKITVTLVMVHAQDHLMTSMLAIEMAEEIIGLQQKVHELSKQLTN